MKICYFIPLLLALIFSCGKRTESSKSITLIKTADEQTALFDGLFSIVKDAMPAALGNDSLSFMILPVQASCPSCRKKSIDSLFVYLNSMPQKHFVIISLQGGLKTANSYFREQGYELPEKTPYLILDTTNQAYKLKLFENNPTFYYSSDRKVYKKASALPATIKSDLHYFFRTDNDGGNL